MEQGTNNSYGDRSEMGTDQKWIQRSLIMSSVVLFMRGPKKALRIYMETYKTPEAMKWSISNLQSVSTNVWPCYTWDFRCETKEQKHLGRLYSLLFSIYTPRSLAPGQLSRTTENSKLPLKYKTALVLQVFDLIHAKYTGFHIAGVCNVWANFSLFF